MTSTRPFAVPDRPSLEGLEERWSKSWEKDGTYRFDRHADKARVFSIDTPPPTVSGSLHVGHVFSYTQTDIIARFMRMRGREVFYPIGWDDNGLATERRVQNYYGVRCDPSMTEPVDLAEAKREHKGGEIPVPRQQFIELCAELTAIDEQAFESIFRRLGLSVDWTTSYTTIGERARRVSQRSFLRSYRRGDAYRKEAPTLWDVDFQTAVAQAELEDREVPGAYHRIAFSSPSGPINIDTTRPELLPACVALVAHPDDPRYQSLFGAVARTPLFDVEVPVLAHELADPEKGTGIAMVCTFGDLSDVTWWRELHLGTRTIVGRDGRLEPLRFGEPGAQSLDPERANEHYEKLVGATVAEARRRITELLEQAGALIGSPRPILHPVKFYERGERALEIVSSRQWYLRTLSLRDELIEAGRAIEWHPQFMRARYESWVEGLTGDWNLSRQRFFGVPFPIWYKVLDDATIDEEAILLPDEKDLPIDPSSDVPPGYTEADRNAPGGFAADPDVMDTWATSSLSPQIVGAWEEDEALFDLVFPMDLRPQAHDIIRTWLFATVVRSLLEHHETPWANTAISGWILDPDRKKMSKSKGNVVVPSDLLERHGTDALRYWAGSARLGADTAFDEQQMRIGRRLAIKLLNASKFVLSLDQGEGGEPSEPVDLSMMALLDQVITEATEALERYEHARALERIETFFWHFCDNYLELVKGRAYSSGAGARSARAALLLIVSSVVRLFAPFLPFVSEEVWSWFNDASVHRSSWPERIGTFGDPSVFEHTAAVLGAIRRAKTAAKVSMRAEVSMVRVAGRPDALAALEACRGDLCEAGHVHELVLVEAAGEPTVEVQLKGEG